MSFSAFVTTLISAANDIIVPALITIAFFAFIYGIVNYFILHGDSEEGRRQGRQFILWGVVGMVILFTVWGIVYILIDTLGFNKLT